MYALHACGRLPRIGCAALCVTCCTVVNARVILERDNHGRSMAKLRFVQATLPYDS